MLTSIVFCFECEAEDRHAVMSCETELSPAAKHDKQVQTLQPFTDPFTY